LNWKTGIIATEGVFYDGMMGNTNELYAKAGVLAVEMEAATMFVIASLRGIRAGCCLNVDNYIFQRLEADSGYQPHKQIVQEGTKSMCKVALDAIIELDA